MTEVFSGRVQRVVYENDDFRILSFVLDSGPDKNRAVTVKGNFPAQIVDIGSWLSFEGSWTDHPQYGRQLTVTRSPVAVQTWTNDRVESALSAYGVGPSARDAIARHAASRGFSVADLLDSGDLSGVENLDETSRLHALSRWRSLRTYMDAATFMSEAGLSASVVGRVWEFFGTDLEQHITEDPWVLVKIPGISFKEVDEVAVKLGISLDNPGRVRGAVLCSIQDCVQEGNVFATTSQIVSRIGKKIHGGAPSDQIAAAIKVLLDRGEVVVDRTTNPGVTAVYDPWHFEVEDNCARILSERAQTPLEESFLLESLCNVGEAIKEAKEAGRSIREVARLALAQWALGKKTSLTEDQELAAVRALTEQVSLLTGLPGTGKTTTLRAVVSILKDMGVPFLLAAPTGIAAKRMTLVTGAEASTIHRAFGARGFMDEDDEREATYAGIVGKSERKKSGGAGVWEYDQANPHPARFVIVDESSMLDLNMMYRLLLGTSKNCRLLFVGDPFQLPSVGAGDVLRDLVKSGVFPHSHLSKIFRQADTSGIILAAHSVNSGNPPKSDGKDFVLLDANDGAKASDLIVGIAKKLYDKRLNFQVLSPRHAGDAGVTELNQRLRLALNPSVAGLLEMKLGGDVVREGDRIMVVKNNYSLGVYNGDVGKVSRIDRRAKQIEVKIFQGPGQPSQIVIYNFGDAAKALRMAYAQTVHKSQGQEYDIIVLPVLPAFGRQLQRNLFYTAITRAKQKVILVGEQSAVEKAVQNNKAEERNTFLDIRLRGFSTPETGNSGSKRERS